MDFFGRCAGAKLPALLLALVLTLVAGCEKRQSAFDLAQQRTDVGLSAPAPATSTTMLADDEFVSVLSKDGKPVLEDTVAVSPVNPKIVVAGGIWLRQLINTADPANPEVNEKVTLTRSELAARLDGQGNQSLTRAQVLRAVVETDEVASAEFHRAFVAMQYYGYLRRTLEQAGYDSWLKVINDDPSNVRLMVNGFMNSPEYRLRFGQP